MYDENEIKYHKAKRKKRLNTKTSINNKNKNNRTKINFNNTIDWKSIFSKLAILFIIMVLVLFIIKGISNNINDENLVINRNIDYIINNSVNYFNNKTVVNIGDSKSLSLEEAHKEHIIDNIIDKNNTSCNMANSYILFTKIKANEYRLKVYLKCDNDDIMLEKDVICENNCQIK